MSDMLSMLLESREQSLDSTSLEEEELKRKRIDLFKGFLPDLFERKENILRKEPWAERDFSPFIINKAMSMHLDTAMFANEMNKLSFLPKQMQYDFYIHGVSRRRRFGWQKKKNEEHVPLITKAFHCNERRALDIIEILTDDDIKEIKKEFYEGGNK